MSSIKQQANANQPSVSKANIRALRQLSDSLAPRMRVSRTRRLSDFITGASEYLIARFRGCEIYLRPHPEERALARVSKDGRESVRCVHPSRRLLRKLLRMRSVSFTSSFAGDDN